MIVPFRPVVSTPVDGVLPEMSRTREDTMTDEAQRPLEETPEVAAAIERTVP